MRLNQKLFGGIGGDVVMKSLKADCLMCVYIRDFDDAYEKYLKTAIDSVLAQTFKDFTFIIIDDGSPEEVVKFLKSYDDKRIQLHSKKNTGLTDSLNFGLQFCQEKYIIRQDADDSSEPTRFEKEIQLLEKYPKCGAAGCWYYYLNEQDIAVESVRLDPMFMETPKVAGSFAGGGCVLRREALLQVGEWKLKYAQDAYMWASMRRLGWELRSVPEILYSYRVHKGQISVRCGQEQRHIAHSMADIMTDEAFKAQV